MSTKNKEPMRIWEIVCKTDPSVVKNTGRAGGLKAICAQSQLKEATKLWGPYGEKWGINNLSFEYLPLGSETPIEIALTGTFYFPDGEFEMSNDMAYRPGQECRKKLITDLRSKCLSTLGFNSDVFEGMYDDNRYVQQLQDEKQNADAYRRAEEAIRKADSTDTLAKIREFIPKNNLSSAQQDTLTRMVDSRTKELAGV